MSKLANLAAAGTVVLWASAFPAITVADRGLGPAGLAVARLVVASAALAALALAAALPRVRTPALGVRTPALGVRTPALGVRRPALRDLPLIAVCGLAGMTGYQLLLNAGERVVPAGTASLLVATAPVYSSLLAVAFLGERAGRRRWAWQCGRTGRNRAHRRFARARVRRIGAGGAGCSRAPGDLSHRAEAAAGPVHQLRGHRLRHVGRHRVRPPVDRVPAAHPASGGRGGHRLGGLPGPGAVGGRVPAVGLRHGPDGRRTGHPLPLPGPGGGHRHRAGLARPGLRPGRAGRRGDRPGRGHPGPGLTRRGG